MSMSAEFCRLQAAVQQQRADESPLDNVRRIAGLAASTWESEAIAAERRDHRRLLAREATEARQHDGEASDLRPVVAQAAAEPDGAIQ